MALKRQNRFTAGELEPQLIARNDGDYYYAGADKLRNVIVIPEGGVKRRMGSIYLNEVSGTLDRAVVGVTITAPNGGVTANANDNDPNTLFQTVTPIGTTNPYIVLHYDIGAAQKVGFVDLVNLTISSGANNTEFFVQTSNDNAAWQTVGNSISLSTSPVTERRKVNDTVRYIRFVRIGATDLGAAIISLGEMNVWIDQNDLSNVRIVPYKFNVGQSYMFVFSDKNVDVYRNRTYQASIRAVDYTSARLPILNWTSGGDKTFLFHEEVPVNEIIRNGSDTLWTIAPVDWQNIPLYDFVPGSTSPATTLTPSALSGRVTLTAGTAAFNAGDINQIIEGNGGRARIIAFTSTTVVEALMEIPFYNTTAITAGNWTILTGWEPSWSATRGYPRSGAFFQSRLWIGGSLSRPRTIWATRLGEFYDFDQGLLRDTDAIEADTDNEEPIINLLAHRSLQVFSTGAESAIIMPRVTAITPTNVGFIPQSETGSQVGLRPVVSNGVILFVQRGGNSISSTVYSDEEGAFTPTNVSLYSSHLIRTPIDFTIRRSTNTEDSTILLAVNNDGTMACGAYMRQENVQAFSLWETEGSYKAVGVDIDDVYTVATRNVNGVDRNLLEVMDFSVTTDAAQLIDTPAAQVTIPHLAGNSIYIRQGTSYAEADADANGLIDVPEYFQDKNGVEFGLNVPLRSKTLPFEDIFNVGERMGNKKRITKVTLRVYETGQFKVNGIPAAFGNYGQQLLGDPTSLFTGDVRIEGMRGWDDLGQTDIVQDVPLPFTLLAIATEASV
jgi:hypothetical protein